MSRNFGWSVELNGMDNQSDAANWKKGRLPRRTFLNHAALLTGAASLTAGRTYSFPSAPRLVTQQGQTSANSKIVVGLIGCGGMGAANMRSLLDKGDKGGVAVAALCDVDEGRIGGDLAEVEKRTGKRPDVYKDYRKMLERPDINVVIVGTPDHWHALNLIHACEAGKDVYCEKPISHNIVEANAMTAAAKRFGRVVQVGTWQRSTREFTDAIAFVRAGKIGRITQARAWRTDGAQVGKANPVPVPSGLDYEMWTGPAQMMPYAANHVHSNWRWFLNYGTGMTGDWGVHMMDIALLGLSADTDLVMPDSVTCYGGKLAFPDDDRTAPDTVSAIYRFASNQVVLSWETGRDHAGRPDHGTEWVSADGRTVRVWRGGWQVLDADGKELPKEQAAPTNDHMDNFLECLRTRQAPRSNLPSMAQTTIVCHLANAAYLAGEAVRWDKTKMDIVGKAGKNTTAYRREYRKGYNLPMYKTV